MLINSKGFTFLTLVHGINTQGVITHPYVVTRGKDKGYFQYSINGSNTFKRATLIELLICLLTGNLMILVAFGCVIWTIPRNIKIMPSLLSLTNQN
jgi:hypothetical protein